MRRLAPVVLVLVLLVLGPGSARAATNEYSTGNIHLLIAGSGGRSLSVPDAGPVSFVRVSFRISTPDTASLAIALVTPRGTSVPLVVHRGRGAGFGSGAPACGGAQTVIESDQATNPISRGTSPFTDSPYRAEGDLRSVYGQQARGRWTLRIEDSGRPATLDCFTLDISRAVPQTLSARGGGVEASVSFVERDYQYQHLDLKIVRRGRTVVDGSIQQFGCRGCIDFRPADVQVRNLDAGGPEVLVDLYSGGAHCCEEMLILRYDPTARRYRSLLADWGNYGARLVDRDHDGLPEFSAFDERFVYTFTAYVFSAAPIQIWSYRQGRLVDVTRRFPAAIRADAASLWHTYLQGRRQKDVDLRSIVAAYVADEYLLGRPAEAKRALDLALARGDLGHGATLLGSPAGKAFVAALMRDLRAWGYLRPPAQSTS